MHRIFIVDDLQDNIQLLQFNLEDEGYLVESTTDSVTAIDKIREFNPDVILADLVMPNLNGIELIQELNTHEILKEIPVIVITAKNDSNDLIEAFDSGAHDYITKPFEWHTLLARVRAALRVSIANAEVRVKSQELEQFAYMASHDLQEPLRGLGSLFDILKEELDLSDESTKKVADLSTQCIMRMSSIISNILELAKVGKKSVHPTSFSLNQCIQDTINILDEKIKSTGSQIVFTGDVQVYGDTFLIGQVFQNIFSNAIKFQEANNPPIIKVELEYKDKNARIEIRIIDNGIGIQADKIDKIFTPFIRLNNRSIYEGTGIGLSICDKIINLHGSKLIVQSEFGKGSTFSFSLPALKTH